ncbi:hypothetical protein RRG08_040158 [Elysia crispata]|uniref:Uncharacterized protein n=1 Tax=Elysia crispata TaxID=231223 RepID=A0AAE0XWK4_9GAST|nr:hypothetical protein RRG08_040158 [Elysia crispata]
MLALKDKKDLVRKLTIPICDRSQAPLSGRQFSKFTEAEDDQRDMVAPTGPTYSGVDHSEDSGNLGNIYVMHRPLLYHMCPLRPSQIREPSRLHRTLNGHQGIISFLRGVNCFQVVRPPPQQTVFSEGH